jgi:hypothetical protein
MVRAGDVTVQDFMAVSRLLNLLAEDLSDSIYIELVSRQFGQVLCGSGASTDQ